jgi:hypothetical protein
MSALSPSSADHARVLPAMFQTTPRSRCWTEGVVKGVGILILSFGFLDITGARLRRNVTRPVQRRRRLALATKASF